MRHLRRRRFVVYTVQYIRPVFYFTPLFYSVTLDMLLHSSSFFVVTVFWYFHRVNDGKYVGTFSCIIVVCIALIGYGVVFGNHLNDETLTFKFVELNYNYYQKPNFKVLE